MESFSVGVAIGVVAAFGGFVLEGWTTSVVQGFRVRKLLAAEINQAVRGLRDHYPSLQEIDDRLADDEPSYIWDGASNSEVPAYVTNAIYHLRTLEGTQCWKFYGVLSRLNLILAEYNASVRHLIAEEAQRELHKKIARACIHDLQRNYTEAISIGSGLLLEIKKNHWCVEVDLSH